MSTTNHGECSIGRGRIRARLPEGVAPSASAIALAIALSTSAFLSIFSHIDPSAFRARARTAGEPHERVTYVAAPTPVRDVPRLAPDVTAPPLVPRTTRQRVIPLTPPSEVDTAHGTSSPAGEGAPSLSVRRPFVPSRRPSPFITLPLPRNPFVPARELTPAERASVLFELGHGLPRAAAMRVPTSAERDSIWREMAMPGTIPGRKAGEQGLGGHATGGVSVPLFSAGPSRGQRARDSAAHEAYLRVLRRLQDRARARHDSAK